jgi:hypothetical protein
MATVVEDFNRFRLEYRSGAEACGMSRREAVIEFGSLGGPIVGAIVSLWPLDTTNTFGRWLWVTGFLLIGALATVAAIRLNRVNKQEIERLLGRGDSFCFFRIDPDGAVNLSEPFQLFMVAVGGPLFDLNYWISPRSARKDKDDPTYFSLDVRKPIHPIIHLGSRGWDKGLPIGAYDIDFDGRNGYWRQSLIIFIDNGKLRQFIRIKDRNGKVLHEEETPA